jgi:hypothetical protein
VWLIKDGKKHPFKNLVSLTSRYRTSQIIQVPGSVLSQYPEGAPIAYPESSLLRTEDEKVYLLINDELRLIFDQETMRHLGFLEDEIVNVSASELAFFPKGEVITMASLDPLGALVQDPNTYGIYYVKNGIKYPLVAPELLTLNFPNLRVRKGTVEELERYLKGAPVLLKDGLLVKSPESPAVYVIANGKKHEIDSEYTFNSLGYSWTNIQTVTQGLLDLHGDGETLSVQQELSDEAADELVSEL